MDNSEIDIFCPIKQETPDSLLETELSGNGCALAVKQELSDEEDYYEGYNSRQISENSNGSFVSASIPSLNVLPHFDTGIPVPSALIPHFNCVLLSKKNGIPVIKTKWLEIPRPPPPANPPAKNGAATSAKDDIAAEAVAAEDEVYHVCTICKDAFRDLNSLRQHFEVHLNPDVEEGIYSCSHCNKTFSMRRKLEMHVKFVHVAKQDTRKAVKLFSCTVCSKAFSRQAGLREHSVMHTGEKKYSCTICNKRFSYSASLIKHKRDLHSGCKPFSCSDCEKTFNSFSARKSHYKFVHFNERPYQCGLCEKSCMTLYRLQVHERFHKGIKPYSCDVCSKAFTQSSDLKVHMSRIHSEERPYTCKICNKSFSFNQALRRHEKTHSGEL